MVRVEKSHTSAESRLYDILHLDDSLSLLYSSNNWTARLLLSIKMGCFTSKVALSSCLARPVILTNLHGQIKREVTNFKHLLLLEKQFFIDLFSMRYSSRVVSEGIVFARRVQVHLDQWLNILVFTNQLTLSTHAEHTPHWSKITVWAIHLLLESWCVSAVVVTFLENRDNRNLT